MAVKERSQIKGTDAQIKAFAGHNGVLAFATDTKSLHVLSGTAGTTTEFLPSNKVATSGSYNDLLDKPSVDSALSSTSENPVQNKVINSALDGKLSTSGGTVNGSITIAGVNYSGLLRGSGVREFVIHGVDNDGSVELFPGNDGSFASKKSASLFLTSTDYTGNTISAGSFCLSAMNATTGAQTLAGNPDGSLTWGGKTVERCLDFSFNGIPTGVDDADTYQGYVKFASGFQMCFGVTRTTNAGRTITFAKPFTFIPAVYASRASDMVTSGLSVSADTGTTTTISICHSSDNNLAIAWLAIGR